MKWLLIDWKRSTVWYLYQAAEKRFEASDISTDWSFPLRLSGE